MAKLTLEEAHSIAAELGEVEHVVPVPFDMILDTQLSSFLHYISENHCADYKLDVVSMVASKNAGKPNFRLCPMGVGEKTNIIIAVYYPMSMMYDPRC